MKKKINTISKVDILERELFLRTYEEFDTWLRGIGFKIANLEEYYRANAVHYSHYEQFIDALCSTEVYINHAINMRIMFQRDRYEHKYMLVGGIVCSCSKVMTEKEFKDQLIKDVRKYRDEKMGELGKLQHV